MRQSLLVTHEPRTQSNSCARPQGRTTFRAVSAKSVAGVIRARSGCACVSVPSRAVGAALSGGRRLAEWHAPRRRCCRAPSALSGAACRRPTLPPPPSLHPASILPHPAATCCNHPAPSPPRTDGLQRLRDGVHVPPQRVVHLRAAVTPSHALTQPPAPFPPPLPPQPPPVGTHHVDGSASSHLPRPRAGAATRSRRQECLHQLQLPVPSCSMQGRLACRRRGIHIRARCDQPTRCRQSTRGRGSVQRRPPIAGCPVRTRPVAQQRIHRCHMVPTRRRRQRRRLRGTLERVDVGALGQGVCHTGHVPPLRCIPQASVHLPARA
jgi:hypothetical protein